MSDDDRLRDVLSDAVSGIEPTDRIDRLRASVRPSSRVVPMARSRYSHASAGILATAAVIGVVALVTHLAADRSSNVAPATDTGGRPVVTTAIATDTSAPSPSTTTAATSAAVYYLGDGPRGTVLYREVAARPATVSPLEYAVQGLMSLPRDPDYTTPWRDGWLRGASTGTGQIEVDLGDAPEARPPSMSARQANEAVQQVVYTLQAAVGRRDAVLFTRDGRPVATLLGVPTTLPVSQGPPLDVLSRMSISTPSESRVVSRGRLVVTGLANSFEASVVVQLKRGGHVVRTQPGLASGYQAGHLFPWRIVVDTRTLTPGRYTVVARADDPSGRNRGESDTRTIELK
jgi:hypothetical protein